MFDEVAARYDRTNDVLSLGQDRRWRRAVVEALDLRPGERLLDLAAGTGTSTEPFADAGVLAVPCDFSLGMLRVGRGRRPDLPFVAGDATAAALRGRRLRRGDHLLRAAQRGRHRGGARARCGGSPGTAAGSWSASSRTRPGRRGGPVYTEYLMRALPAVARRVSSSPDSYVYLAESIRAWPDQRRLGEQIAAAGWSRSPTGTSPAASSPCTAPSGRLTRRAPGTVEPRGQRVATLRIACCVAGPRAALRTGIPLQGS